MPANNFLQQTCEIVGKSGYDGFGNQKFGASKTVKCKFVEKANIVRNTNGDEVVSDAVCYVSKNVSVSLEDKVVYEGVDYEILFLTTQRKTVTTLGHKKLMLQRFKV